MRTGNGHTNGPMVIGTDHLLDRVREKVQTCIGCGTCTASCPNYFAMDLPPRQLWRLVLLGQTREVFDSRTFSMCSSCYSCTLRCPRGLPLTEAMADLKQIAARSHMENDLAGSQFHRLFLKSVRRNGRISETYLMAAYLMRMGVNRPAFPLAYSKLGFNLMQRGKLSFRRPGRGNSLERIFRKVEDVNAFERSRPERM